MAERLKIAGWYVTEQLPSGEWRHAMDAGGFYKTREDAERVAARLRERYERLGHTRAFDVEFVSDTGGAAPRDEERNPRRARYDACDTCGRGGSGTCHTCGEPHADAWVRHQPSGGMQHECGQCWDARVARGDAPAEKRAGEPLLRTLGQAGPGFLRRNPDGQKRS